MPPGTIVFVKGAALHQRSVPDDVIEGKIWTGDTSSFAECRKPRNTSASGRAPSGAPCLGTLSDDQLLSLRFCDEAQGAGTELEKAILRLYRSSMRGIQVSSSLLVGAGVVLPDGIPGTPSRSISAHRRLMSIVERRFMREVEGGNRTG